MKNLNSPKIKRLRIQLEPISVQMETSNKLLEFSKSNSSSGAHYFVTRMKTNKIVGVICFAR